MTNTRLGQLHRLRIVAVSGPFDKDLGCILLGDFKFIWSSDGKNELYNISEDPGEIANLVRVETEVSETLGLTLR